MAGRNETKAIVTTVALGFVAIVVIARLTNDPAASTARPLAAADADADAAAADAAGAAATADASPAAGSAIDAGAEP